MLALEGNEGKASYLRPLGEAQAVPAIPDIPAFFITMGRIEN